MKDEQKDRNREQHQIHQDKVGKHTIHLDNEEIERMPASDDDYRLPRELPEEEPAERSGLASQLQQDEEEGLLDEDSDISPEELALLEEAERDTSSDESRASDILDDRDDDGDELNEGPDEDNAFDTGEDLDMPNDVNNPDIDQEDERF